MHTPQQIVEDFIKGTQRHAAYLDAVDIEDHLSFHIDGFNPERFNRLEDHQKAFMRFMGIKPENPYFNLLIDERRPGESLKVRNHRRKIYASITQEPCFKVISSLNKIVRSDDWKIDYSNAETISREGENLEDYCEKNYPGFGSVTNWAYTLGLKKVLSDPNGFMVVLPIKFPTINKDGTTTVKANEFLQPFVNYIPSKDVLFYEPKVAIAYKSPHVTTIVLDNGTKQVPVFRIITTDGVWETHQNDAKGNFILTPLMVFDMELPVVMNGGVLDKLISNIPLYNSFLNPMLPRLDEAAREYSDMQAEVLLHIHSTLAVIQGEKCNKCKGTGLIPKEGGAVACGDCGGRGAAAIDPYETIVVRIRDADKQQIPFPPAQYITKSTDIVKIQDERIDQHIFKSLSSINMEFLAETPLNQSGKAKEVDKEELNNFVYSIAFHLVRNILDPIYKIISDYRYSVIIPDQMSRNKLLPLIQVPEHFDLLTENALIEQIGKAKEAGVDATIIQEMQIDYVNKKFRDSPKIRNTLIASLDMNPFPTFSSEELIEMEMNNDITQKDAVQSFYANYFVQKSVEADDKFLSKTFEEQLDIIQTMTEEKIVELDEQKALKEPEVVPPIPVPPVVE